MKVTSLTFKLKKGRSNEKLSNTYCQSPKEIRSTIASSLAFKGLPTFFIHGKICTTINLLHGAMWSYVGLLNAYHA
jgi:hypothetical protein